MRLERSDTLFDADEVKKDVKSRRMPANQKQEVKNYMFVEVKEFE